MANASHGPYAGEKFPPRFDAGHGSLPPGVFCCA